MPPRSRCEDSKDNKAEAPSDSKTDDYGIIRVQKSINGNYLLGSNDTCCAENALGRECSHLYTVDLTSEQSHPEVLIKTGEPLVIRCYARYRSYEFSIEWDTETQKMTTFEQSTNEGGSMLRVLFASSEKIRGGQNRNLTCTSTAHKNKMAPLTLLDKGFIDMNTTTEEYDIDRKENHCCEVEFKAYPSARCAWIHQATPTLCTVYPKDNGKSFSRYCSNKYEPGDEIVFYIDNGDVQLNKTFILNIRQKPKVDHKLSSVKNITCWAQSYPLSEWTWWRSKDASHNCTEAITDGITYGPLGRSAEAWESSSTLVMESGTGTFSICCCASNSVGKTCAQISFSNHERNDLALPIATVSCAFSLVIAIVIFVLMLKKFKKQYKYENQLLMIQYVGPSDNEYIYINFNVLEYDLKWEFPRENLEIGDIIGSGAFGKVVTATAYGISKPGVSLQVAVKMLKENHDSSEKDALMSELKMMTQIGHHDNVVNLLGACTASGPVYLIFEYCPHGDLLNYLKGKRDTFHKTWSDVFQDNNFSFYLNFKPEEKFRERAVTSISNSSYSGLLATHSCDKNQYSWDLSSGQSDILQDGELKYQNTGKYDEEDLNVLTLEDLLSFSYQVAKGMEFLESKMCIHRDLAARNVLITKGKTAKICDFGLARDVENDSNYVVKGNARLPVKWMAPESIFDGIYTIKSDIWSYGILLWEIFSLGVNPYPGMPVNANFYKLLQSGFKMDQPFYATDEIYFLMQSCWAFEPKKRPSFTELVSFLGYQISNTESVLYKNMKNNTDTSYTTMTSRKEEKTDHQSLLVPLI
ncbi:receptor-type tyrosine-protein kinase FLT3 isoform X2 [Hyperolius riggenbachi]|uniref:receptor-type tyrosine-protein kinase FLT3 isoform X2 n=1 Tax=Hyperolius riggenbachi TaxID=752182 RepID=UPI0035A30F67